MIMSSLRCYLPETVHDHELNFPPGGGATSRRFPTPLGPIVTVPG
jgi:hypothetical protein